MSGLILGLIIGFLLGILLMVFLVAGGEVHELLDRLRKTGLSNGKLSRAYGDEEEPARRDQAKGLQPTTIDPSQEGG